MKPSEIDAFLDGPDDEIGAFLDAPNDPKPQGEDHVLSLGRAVMAALQQSMKAASPFERGPITTGAASAAREGAPGAVAGFTGTELPPDASMTAKAVAPFADPVTLASMGAGLATGGASIPARVGLQALTTGAGAAMKEGARQAVAGEDNAGKVLAEGGMQGAISGAIEGVIGGAGKAYQAIRPSLISAGAKLIRTTSAVPEKYGRAVLENPEILKQPSVQKAARDLYKATVKDTNGLRDYLQEKTGNVIQKSGDVVDLINTAFRKLPKRDLTLEEALSARQGVSQLLQAPRYANPEHLATKASLIQLKGQLDDFIEEGLPGFKTANRKYFEEHAREAFGELFPQNKNLSPNALRSLGMLAQLSAASLMRAPELLLTAGAGSPLVTGLAIRGGNAVAGPAALSAKFAARIAATKATGGNGVKP